MSKSGRDPLLVNKLLGGGLTVGIVLWAAVHVANGLMYTSPPEKPAIKIAGGRTGAVVAAVALGIPSINNLIPKANVMQGKTFVGQQCAACHSLNKGGANGVGPNLYGVMNAAMFGTPGYSYSSAVKSKASGKWTYHKMNDWLYDPQKFAPGTHMTYSGVKNTNVRADVVAYLRSLSTNPIPLPKPEPVVASAGAGYAGKTAATAASKSAGGGAPPIATLYAAASVSKGQGFFQQQCAACHSINKGGANGVGPNLYGVLQEKMFAKAGYDFSSAVKSKAQGKWTPHLMNQWLFDPMKYAPGTHMTYPGIKNNQMRANVIAYLNHESANPEALQKAAPANAAYKQTPQANPQGNAPNDTMPPASRRRRAKAAIRRRGRCPLSPRSMRAAASPTARPSFSSNAPLAIPWTKAVRTASAPISMAWSDQRNSPRQDIPSPMRRRNTPRGSGPRTR